MERIKLSNFDNLLKKECDYTSNDIDYIGLYDGHYYIGFPNTTEMYKVDINFRTIEFIDNTVYALQLETDGQSLGQKSTVIFRKD